MREDLIAILSYIKGYLKSTKIILVTVLIFVIIALFQGCTTRDKYKSSSRFLVQLSDLEKVRRTQLETGNVIGSTFSKDVTIEDIPVLFYPRIIASSEFRNEILQTKVYIGDIDQEVTLKKFILEIDKPDGIDILAKYTIGLPGLLFGGGSDGNKKIIDSLEYMTAEDIKLQSKLEEILEFTVDEDDRSNYLVATLTDPVGAAQVALSAQEILQRKIIDYRILKAQRKFEFIDQQYQEKKKSFYDSQARLASYTDRNAYNITERSLVTKKRLQMEYEAQSIAFAELDASRVRQAALVEENTPAFVTLQSPSVPLEPSNMSVAKLVLIFILIGLLASVFVYVIYTLIAGSRRLWKYTD